VWSSAQKGPALAHQASSLGTFPSIGAASDQHIHQLMRLKWLCYMRVKARLHCLLTVLKSREGRQGNRQESGTTVGLTQAPHFPYQVIAIQPGQADVAHKTCGHSCARDASADS